MRNALFVAALMASATVVHASDKPIYAPAPDWVTPAAAIDPAKLGNDAPVFLILDRQQRLQDGQVWAYQDTETRAASPQVLSQIGTVSLSWSPDKGDLIVHRAEIIRGGEHIDLLKGGDPFTVLHREQQLEQMQLDGMLTATMPVSGLRVGDILRLTYSVTSKDPTLDGNAQWYAPILAAPFRVQFARERMIWADGIDLHYKVLGDKIAPAVSDDRGYHQLVITEPVAKQPDMPDDAPARYRRGTALQASTFGSWAAISKIMAPLYDTRGTIAPGSPLAAEVARIEKQSSDPATRAMLALQTVQDKVRYLFKGMDNGNYVPQKPADTWQLRYGDCKAKTMLLLALLHEMKIDAEPVLASSQLGDALPTALPMPGAFDHVFVHATVAGKSLWLDGTDTGAQLADINDVPPFRNVLPVRAAGAGIVTLPMRANARPDMDVAIDYDQSAGLSLPTLYSFTMKTRGQVAQLVRVAQSQASKDQIDDMIRKAIAPFLGNAVIADDSISYDDSSATAMVRASGLVASKWNREDQQYRVPLDFIVDSLNFSPDRNRAAWHDIPIATGAAGHMRFRMTMKLPDDGKGFTIDGARQLSADLGGSHIERTLTVRNGTITVDDEVTSDGGEIAAADLPKARAAVSDAKSRPLRAMAPRDYPSHWQLGQAIARDHRDKAIVATYEKAVAKETEDADKSWAYSNLAYYHAGIFDFKAALADLDQAIKLQADTDLYLRRGRIHHELGDQDAALADYKAAQALDPGASKVINGLAWAEAEHGDKDAALALVDDRIDAADGNEKAGYLNLKASILNWTGNAQQAMDTINSAIAARPGDPNLLNSRCWIEGTQNTALDMALKDCTKAMELADSSASVLDSRAMVYFRMNRTEDALADLNAALDINPDLAASLYMRGVIRTRQGKTSEAAADLAAARLISPQIADEYRPYGIAP